MSFAEGIIWPQASQMYCDSISITTVEKQDNFCNFFLSQVSDRELFMDTLARGLKQAVLKKNDLNMETCKKFLQIMITREKMTTRRKNDKADFYL